MVRENSFGKILTSVAEDVLPTLEQVGKTVGKEILHTGEDVGSFAAGVAQQVAQQGLDWLHGGGERETGSVAEPYEADGADAGAGAEGADADVLIEEGAARDHDESDRGQHGGAWTGKKRLAHREGCMGGLGLVSALVGGGVEESSSNRRGDASFASQGGGPSSGGAPERAVHLHRPGEHFFVSGSSVARSDGSSVARSDNMDARNPTKPGRRAGSFL